MAGVGGFRGVSASQDARFADKTKKLMKTLKFPKEYEFKVETKKVNMEVMKGWIAKRVTELLGVEDDVMIAYIFEQLESMQKPDARELQINLTPFLEKNTSLFVKELWTLLASASENVSGIPQKILDEKAEEQRRRKDLQDSINAKLDVEHRKRDQEAREKEISQGRNRWGPVEGRTGNGRFDDSRGKRNASPVRDKRQASPSHVPPGSPERRARQRSPAPRRSPAAKPRGRENSPKRSRSPGSNVGRPQGVASRRSRSPAAKQKPREPSPKRSRSPVPKARLRGPSPRRSRSPPNRPRPRELSPRRSRSPVGKPRIREPSPHRSPVAKFRGRDTSPRGQAENRKRSPPADRRDRDRVKERCTRSCSPGDARYSQQKEIAIEGNRNRSPAAYERRDGGRVREGAVQWRAYDRKEREAAQPVVRCRSPVPDVNDSKKRLEVTEGERKRDVVPRPEEKERQKRASSPGEENDAQKDSVRLKKHKKEKRKHKKEKTEKKEKKRDKMQKQERPLSPSRTSSGDSAGNGVGGGADERKQLEQELREKALAALLKRVVNE